MLRLLGLCAILLVSLSTRAFAYEFNMAAKGPVVSAAGANDIKSADLNGDGRADAVTAHSTGQGVSYVLGQANGTISASTFLAGGHAMAVDLADYDGNGTIDILEADWNENVVRLRPNLGGASFGPAVTYAVTGNPRDVVSADFDGDGVRDVAVATGNGKVALLLGLAGGGFAPATYATYATNLQGIAVGDLDQDGDADLAVIEQSTNSLIRLRNDGGGIFTVASSLSLFGQLTDVAIADLDGDGWPDAAASSEAGWAMILKGGAAAFDPGYFYYQTGAHAQSIAIANFDQQNGPDLVVSLYTSPGGFQTLRNQGGLQFGGLASWNLGYGQVRSAAAGDIDGDGRIDVFYADTNSGGNTYPYRNTPVYGSVTYDAQPIDFGAGYQGNQASGQITFHNVGATTLRVFPGSVEGGQFVLDASSKAKDIAPGTLGRFTIWCLRSALGEAAGIVHFTTTDTLTPALAIDLAAVTIPAVPQLAYDPGTLDFGADVVGVQEVLALTLSNPGHAVLTVTPGAIDGSDFAYASGSDPI
jgi:hypothetical protein